MVDFEYLAPTDPGLSQISARMFVSSYPSIHVPKQNLIEFVLGNQSEVDSDKPIFIDPGKDSRCYTTSSLTAAARQFGTGLQSTYAFRKGDVVAVFSANSIDYPMIVFGIFYAGGTVTLVNSVYREGEVASQLKDSGAKIIYTTAELLSTALAACAIAGMSSAQVVVCCSESTLAVTQLSSVMSSGKSALIASAGQQGASLDTYDIAFLCYSSGTTGLSKGVRLTHRNLVANLLQWDAGETFLNRESSLISVLPFSHIYALNILVMNPIRRRISNYVLPRFHHKRYFELIEAHRITASFIVPPIVQAFLSTDAASYDLSSLTFLCSGAAPLSLELARKFSALYPIPLSQGFGMTETSPVLSYARFDAHKYTGSVGRLLPNVEMRVVDETGRCQGPNEAGELHVRGPNVMLGYLNNEEANTNAFTQDGFFRTGDLGYVSDEGFVFVIDRIKELIKYKGFQVPPLELENLLLTHPAILDCAVIGINCEIEATELPTAYCVLCPRVLESMSLDLPAGWKDLDRLESDSFESLKHRLAQDIMAFIANKVSNYKKLRGGIVFTDCIPRVPAGKILRRLLQERTEHRILPCT